MNDKDYQKAQEALALFIAKIASPELNLEQTLAEFDSLLDDFSYEVRREGYNNGFDVGYDQGSTRY